MNKDRIAGCVHIGTALGIGIIHFIEKFFFGKGLSTELIIFVMLVAGILWLIKGHLNKIEDMGN